MYRLGIDIGASSCQLILLGEEGEILWRESFLHHNKVKSAVVESLQRLNDVVKGKEVLLSVCGTMSHLLGLASEFTSSDQHSLRQPHQIGRAHV